MYSILAKEVYSAMHIPVLAPLACLVLSVGPPRDVSALLAPLVQQHDVPALCAVVIEGDQVVLEGISGVRAKGQPEKATMEDLWHLGSCTKAMTATLAAIEVERGHLSWDSKLLDVFPKLKQAPAGQVKPAWANVTLAHLCTNSGGVPGDLSADGLWSKLWNTNETPAELRRILLAGILKNEPRFEPGTAYEYSNAGFSIAGAMIERTEGKPWESLVQQQLFDQLDIHSAGFGAPGVPGEVSQPWGHGANGTAMEPKKAADNPMAIAPAGGIHMSIRDWAKFVTIHLQGDKANPARTCHLLMPESFDLLHSPVHNNYAAGWGVSDRPWADGPDDDKQGRVLTHSGSNTMWFCVTWIAPERNFAVLVCCNQGGGNASKAADAASWTLIQELLKDAKPATENPSK